MYFPRHDRGKGRNMRKCDECEHEFGEWCTHPKIEEKRRSNPPSTNSVGDLWGYDETPNWCPIKDFAVEAKGESDGRFNKQTGGC